MNQTHSRICNLIILDESGSMQSIRTATINGFNELLQSIRQSVQEFPGIEQYVNFYSFNGAGITEHLPLCRAENLIGLSPEKYRPDNMTPLYDAIGFAVNRLWNELRDEGDCRVLVSIFTDGEENISREYTFESVTALIKEMRSRGWVFTYIGANHNAESVAVSLNINNHLQFVANDAGTGEMIEKSKTARKRFMDKLNKNRSVDDSGYFDEENKSRSI